MERLLVQMLGMRFFFFPTDISCVEQVKHREGRRVCKTFKGSFKLSADSVEHILALAYIPALAVVAIISHNSDSYGKHLVPSFSSVVSQRVDSSEPNIRAQPSLL